MSGGIYAVSANTPDASRATPGGHGIFALLLLWLCGVCLRITVLTLPPVIPLVLPLVDNSWRLDFVVWSLPVFATALLVFACAPRPQAVNNSAARAHLWWPDWRRPLIWRLGGILGSVNAMYFVTNAFLPD